MGTHPWTEQRPKLTHIDQVSNLGFSATSVISEPSDAFSNSSGRDVFNATLMETAHSLLLWRVVPARS